MRILFAASEVAGFAKTGGLADVAASLPRALVRRGLEVAVFMPFYRSARQSGFPLQPTGLRFSIPVGNREVTGALWRSWLPVGADASVTVYLIEQPEYFDRDDPAKKSGLYQYTQRDGKTVDYPDNCARFVFFSRAVLEAMTLVGFWPDVIHANDWQTGLLPVYLREYYPQQTWGAQRARYEQIRTLFTIHNLAYQGVFWHWDMNLTGLPWRLFNFEQLEFHGNLNTLKSGLVFSEMLTTVSPTYAREIQTPFFGCGLQGVLLQRSQQLRGIVNGADYEVWDPAIDPHIAAPFSDKALSPGKPACKKSLQARFGLRVDPNVPLLGMVSRLADQKGLDLLAKVAKPLLEEEHVQLVVLGMGDPRYHQMLQGLNRDYPGQVGVHLALDEKVAHQIEAGADMFLMPSQYEPCGLNQLYSLKYGTVPIVRATGGLADTVVDATPENLVSGRATGFSFLVYSPEAFLDAVRRALNMYHDEPGEWQALQQRGMRQDWSWNRSAMEYEALYRALISR